MAVGGGKPVLGGIDPFSGEPFEIVLEDELIHDFELHTLVKPTVENYNEYSQRYNMICKDIQETGNERFLGEIIDLRYAARRQALNDVPLELNESPYTERGAALCYGYIEGARERNAKMAKGDDIFDSSTYITMKPSVDMRVKRPEDFAAIFGTPITPESESSGISKIAAGISMGQLKKSKF